MSDRKRGRPVVKTPVLEGQVAMMTAGGIPTRTQAVALGISSGTVQGLKSRPEVKRQIDELRLAIRHITSQRVHQHVGGLYDWIGEAIDARGDPRGLSFLTKAATDLERVSQGSKFDGPVEAELPTAPHGELKKLLAILLEK